MTTQSIQSHDIKIADVFQAFYSVPDYQREYVWESEHVEQLLTDIYNEADGAEPENAPEYFIGSIVVCPGADSVFDLIDGQQRMTTLFLTLCALRDRFDALKRPAPVALMPQISTTAVDARGRDVFRYRLALQYEDSGDVLVQLAKGARPVEDDKASRSITNILNAYDVITTFLVNQFAEDTDALRAFYGYFNNKVKLIRIHTENVAKALKIFETINDRGASLDSMDLLKNLLFMKSPPEEFEALKKVWKELQDTIYAAHEKPLRFLRYFIFSRYSVERLREDEIYGWFAKNHKVCGYAENPLPFAQELLDAAKAYRNFLRGCDPSGVSQPELEGLKYLVGSAARQHLILLLAGRHLPSERFRRLVREVENLFFVYVACRQVTRDFERNFALWAPELRAATTKEDLDLFFQERIERAKAGLSTRFDDAFKRMTAEGLQAYRLRYILAKLNQHVEMRAYGETEGTKWLKNYVANEFQVEHIQPTTPCPAARDEFGEVSDQTVFNMLGNLVLVEKQINGSLGNKAYSQKRLVYPKSKLLLVHAIAERPKIGANTSVDRAVRNLDAFSTWNEAAVASRQLLLAKLAREIWNVPDQYVQAGNA